MAMIQLKRGQSADIDLSTLKVAEPAFTIDTGKLYVGNGTDGVLINPDKVKASGEADKLKEAKDISISGDVVATASFDGSANITLEANLKASGVTVGAHTKVTVDEKGIVTQGGALEEADIPSLGAAKIIEATDKKFMTDAEKAKVANVETIILKGDTFNTDMTTVNGLGGIKAGENLDGLTMEEVLTKLLYPYVAPSISGSSTPNGGVFECGNKQNVTKIRASVGKKSQPITKVEIFDGPTSLGVKTDGVATGGNFDFDVTVEVSTNKSFKVKATDTDNKTVEANTGGFTFVYPYYIGACEEDATIDEDLVEGLDKKIETKGNKSNAFNCNNQRMVFAYPKAHGALRQIIDPNNFDVTGTFGRQEVTITGLDETPQEYYVYVNSASTVSNFTVKFNY